MVYSFGLMKSIQAGCQLYSLAYIHHIHSTWGGRPSSLISRLQVIASEGLLLSVLYFSLEKVVSLSVHPIVGHLLQPGTTHIDP